METGINFTGAFLVKNPPKVARNQLEILAGRRRLIFENFNNKSDMFYVVRPAKERRIAEFILQNNLRFKFFSRINTKSGLDPMFPGKAVAKTKEDQYIIDKKEVLAKKFGMLTKQIDYDYNIKGITGALNLNAEELSIRHKGGVTYAFTKDGRHVFKSSPVNRYHENYVYFNSGLNGDKVKKYLIHGDRIICEYPYNARYFDENFNNALIPRFDESV